MIKGKHDFTSFSKTHTDVNHFFCEIFDAEWVKKDEQIIFGESQPIFEKYG